MTDIREQMAKILNQNIHFSNQNFGNSGNIPTMDFDTNKAVDQILYLLASQTDESLIIEPKDVGWEEGIKNYFEWGLVLKIAKAQLATSTPTLIAREVRKQAETIKKAQAELLCAGLEIQLLADNNMKLKAQVRADALREVGEWLDKQDYQYSGYDIEALQQGKMPDTKADSKKDK